jgi:hypothetical protein
LDVLIPVTIVSGKPLDLGIIVMEEDQVSEVQISMVRLFDTDLGETVADPVLRTFAIFKDAFQQAAASIGAGTI